MTVNKRKKSTRHRGHKTHGWGAKKKHRGKGHQGGAGNAGSGKRADSKKPSYWSDPLYFGKHGFISKSRAVKVNAVNVGFLEQHIHNYVNEKLVSKEKDHYVVDLEKLGYNKLLGDGKVTAKFKITTPFASASAVEKIKEAGGEVSGLTEVKKSE
ncbi:MAG TPA: uL15 family ribosomal protein [Candidatus Nanoarchaeia archaeon]|nr:uL15 family ribosomal protein [Candidatus Nanoarchaeia archaeon]